ncbi:MAG: type IX secretion system membrane protein PorP/SprF [Anditalea sp.]
MRKCIKLTCLILTVILLTIDFAFTQQLPLFSQYVFNSLHINPGYAGYKLDPFVQATYRSQYIEFPGAPKTFSISADMGSLNDKMGFGVSVSSDQLGATRTNTALLTYAYRIQTATNSFLGMGISAGASEYMLDFSLLHPDDLSDATIPAGRQHMFTPNLNAGLFFHTDRFFAGFSAFNLIGKRNFNREDMSLAFHNIHYYLQVGGLLPITDQVEFKPSVLIREAPTGPTNYDINGMFLLYEKLWLGAAYRSHLNTKSSSDRPDLSNRNAIAMIVEVFATDQMRIGYAYDYNMNVLNNYRNNSHEISVGLYFGSRGIDDGILKCF